MVDSKLHTRSLNFYIRSKKIKSDLIIFPKKRSLEYYAEVWCDQKGTEGNVEELDVFDRSVVPITQDELREPFRKIKNRKSAGPDGINAELLMHGGKNLLRRLLAFFNKCWMNARIPQTWYKAWVVPIFKIGDPSKSSNYRDISLLNLSLIHI